MSNVRFAVIGTSWITGAFIEAARTVPGAEIVAVYSRSRDGAADFAATHDVASTHDDLAALGADPGVDAVYIASPNSLHAVQAIQMLRAGKHVLVEKPLGVTAAQVEAIMAAAHESGRLVMEAFVAPFEPNVAALRDALPELGALRRAVLVKEQYSSRYDQVKAGGVPNAFSPAFAGGSLMDIGVYPVSLAIHLFGAPNSVVATGRLLDTGVDGQGTILLGYDGFEVVCLHSKINPGGIGSEIAGEDGVLTFEDCSVPTSVVLTRRVGAPGERTAAGFRRVPGGTEDLTRPQSPHHMRYEVEEFVNLVTQGDTQSRLHPPSRSLAALRVLDEARRQVGVSFLADEAPGI